MFTFTAPLWLHTNDAAWHFVTLPAGIADEITEAAAEVRRGFGSVRVTTTVGETTWNTSIFPDSKIGSFVLPVKKAVRLGEKLREGDDVTVSIVVVDI